MLTDVVLAGKGLMADFGIRVQKGKVASSVEEAYKVAKELVSESEPLCAVNTCSAHAIAQTRRNWC